MAAPGDAPGLTFRCTGERLVMSNQLAQDDIPLSVPGEDSPGVENTVQPSTDNRDASARMLAINPIALFDAELASITCRHFRNQVPREIADELRDQDPEPCHVCDTMPHRRHRILSLARI